MGQTQKERGRREGTQTLGQAVGVAARVGKSEVLIYISGIAQSQGESYVYSTSS